MRGIQKKPTQVQAHFNLLVPHKTKRSFTSTPLPDKK